MFWKRNFIYFQDNKNVATTICMKKKTFWGLNNTVNILGTIKNHYQAVSNFFHFC